MSDSVSAEERCPVCGQPDNCGDCNHFGTEHYAGDDVSSRFDEGAEGELAAAELGEGPREYVVTFTSIVVEAGSPEEAIERACDFKGGGQWDAQPVGAEGGE